MSGIGLTALQDLQDERGLVCRFIDYADKRERQVGRISVRDRWQRRTKLAWERLDAIDTAIFDSWISDAPAGGVPLAKIRKAS